MITQVADSEIKLTVFTPPFLYCRLLVNQFFQQIGASTSPYTAVVGFVALSSSIQVTKNL